MSAGSAAELAASSKETKHACGVVASLRVRVRRLRNSRILLQEAYTDFISELGSRMSATTAEKMERVSSFRDSIILQRFNAVCVSDTFGNFGVAVELLIAQVV